jgi:6-phosphogluconate dehydrogenase
MEIGIVGLGRMGANLARQAIERGHRVVGFDRSKKAGQALAKDGLTAASSLQDLASKLQSPRFIIIYVPHGKATNDVIDEMSEKLPPMQNESRSVDIVADGGNTHWKGFHPA